MVMTGQLEFTMAWHVMAPIVMHCFIPHSYTPHTVSCHTTPSNRYPRTDPGGGSFWFSDFHHNGDLGDYGDPWQNHNGKIYGVLDDLRTEHSRVQDKIIAMTKSLITTTDIDGIRMD